jgi:hypothetical protein
MLAPHHGTPGSPDPRDESPVTRGRRKVHSPSPRTSPRARPSAGPAGAADPAGAATFERKALERKVGLGRIVAWCYRFHTLYQIRSHIRCLCL